MPNQTRALLCLLLIPVLLAGGCGGSISSAGGAGQERVRGSLSTHVEDRDPPKAEDEVARRSDATPAEIFAVGTPQEVGVRPDGSLITAWIASADTEGEGEGPMQQAWRVFDADGRRLAQGRMSQNGDVLAVSDGFLVLDGALDAKIRVLHVARSGRVTRVQVSDQRSYPRRGDTLVPDYAAYYRASTGRLLTSSVPTRVRQAGVAGGKNGAVSETGVLYLSADPVKAPLPVAVTADRGRTWRVAQVRTGRYRPSLIATHGDTAAIALARSIDGTGFAGLSVTHDAGRTWQRTGADSGLPADKYVEDLTVGADGRVLVGGFGTGWWRSTSTIGASYAQVPLPRDGVSAVRGAQDRLFAMSLTGIWSSTDDGKYWTRLDARR